jgi:hypothetical protein
MDERLPTDRDQLITAATLVGANIMPAFGVLALGWDVGSILFVYWLESAVVGFFNVLKMVQAQGPLPPTDETSETEANAEKRAELSEAQQSLSERGATLSGGLGLLARAAQASLQARQDRQVGSQPALPPAGTLALANSCSRLTLIPFFILHYGMFMLVHGIFLISFFGPPSIPIAEMLLTMFLLFLSHGVSYILYFLLRGEYRWVSPNEQMFRPYGRIVIMHLTIIFSGLLIRSVGAPASALLVMIGLKVVIDLVAHFRSHARTRSFVMSSVR